MNSLIIACYLWTRTRTLKKEDVQSLIAEPQRNLKTWQKYLKNHRLKEYLASDYHWIEKNKKEISEIKDKGYYYSYWGGKDYLSNFTFIDSPPLFYTYKGNIELLKQKRLSIVGSRQFSDTSKKWLETYLYYYLLENPTVIVSGAAIGIDQLSHKIALDTGSPIIGIFPSGLENIYPYSYNKIINKVSEGAYLFLSEYSLSDAMKKYYFVQRNRLIAAMGGALFVVEAKRRSGSLITARYAIEMGRDIYVLPSSPISSSGLGTLDLLFDGAYPLRDHLDLKAIMT